MKKGFTLLEIVLALAIFATAMMVLVGFHARGYVNEGRARMLTIAVELAREKMVEFQLGVEKEVNKGVFPDEKSEEGDFDKPFEDYHWKTEIRRVELPVPQLGQGQGEGGENATGLGGDVMKQMMQMMTKQISEAVREIKLTISWKEMEKDRNFSIVTHIVKM